MPRSVTVRVHFNRDRSMRLELSAPTGPVDAGTTTRSRDLGRMAQDAAAHIYGSDPVDVTLLVDEPPWLKRGMLVRPVAPSNDPGERLSHPYGQVMGFLPVGGVLVWHPETSANVYAPEDLVICAPDSIDAHITEEISRRTGIDAVAE